MSTESSKSTEMVAVETAVANMDKVSTGLAELAKRFKGVVFDVTTSKGMTEAKAARTEVKEPRLEVERIRKAAKAPILELGRKLDKEAARITAELEALEGPIDAQIKAEENRIEAERQAKIAAEVQRVADLEQRVIELSGSVDVVRRYNCTAAQIAEHIGDLERVPVDESFQEYQESAATAKADALKILAEFHAAAVAREAEAERLRLERIELDRQRAEQAERDRVARDAREAEEKAARDKRDAEVKAENERLARERAAFEAEQAEAREKERQRQAAIDAENARIAAEQAAAQKVIDDQRRALEAAQQAERDAQAKRERDAREAEERRVAAEQEQANKERMAAEDDRRRNHRPTFDEILAVLATHYNRDVDTVRTWVQEPKASKRAA